MQLVNLEKVIKEAGRDMEFMNRLLVNANAALSQKGWKLSDPNKDQLRKMLKERKDLTKHINFLHKHIVRDVNPWLPPPWAPSWIKNRGPK